MGGELPESARDPHRHRIAERAVPVTELGQVATPSPPPLAEMLGLKAERVLGLEPPVRNVGQRLVTLQYPGLVLRFDVDADLAQIRVIPPVLLDGDAPDVIGSGVQRRVLPVAGG